MELKLPEHFKQDLEIHTEKRVLCLSLIFIFLYVYNVSHSSCLVLFASLSGRQPCLSSQAYIIVIPIACTDEFSLSESQFQISHCSSWVEGSTTSIISESWGLPLRTKSLVGKDTNLRKGERKLS